MSLKYGTEKIMVGEYKLIERTSYERSSCSVWLNKVKIATYRSVREALFRKSEWFEPAVN